MCQWVAASSFIIDVLWCACHVSMSCCFKLHHWRSVMCLPCVNELLLQVAGVVSFSSKIFRSKLEGHSVERMYLRQSCYDNSWWIKPLLLQPNTYGWDFPDIIKCRIAAHMISEKAIRFRHHHHHHFICSVKCKNTVEKTSIIQIGLKS